MTKKLHLGCGQIYLKGYVNIDFPLDHHSVQQTSVADEFADLTTLRYKPETVDEVRLHHVFEHFPRTQAIALLASWHSWLKPGGIIHIEVPDFEKTARLALGRLTNDHSRKVAMRHIFGSNEAPWAVHYDAWTRSRLTELLGKFGFKVDRVDQTSYKATRNIAIIGHKVGKNISKEKDTKIAKEYLRGFTVDDSKSETELLDVWLDDFKQQLDKTYASK